MANSFNNDYPCANGELSLVGVASVAIAAAGTYYVVNSGGTTTLSMGTGFDTSAAGRLRYIGSKTILAHCGVTISWTYSSSTQVNRFRLAKNGTTIATSQVEKRVGTGSDVNTTAIHEMVSLATNDYIEVFATDDLGTNQTVTLTVSNLFAIAIPSS